MSKGAHVPLPIDWPSPSDVVVLLSGFGDLVDRVKMASDQDDESPPPPTPSSASRIFNVSIDHLLIDDVPAGPSVPPKNASATASPPSPNSTMTPSSPSTASSTASSPDPPHHPQRAAK